MVGHDQRSDEILLGDASQYAVYKINHLRFAVVASTQKIAYA
jgi:hypothetical protein